MRRRNPNPDVPESAPELLRWMLANGYRGWVRVRTSTKANSRWSNPGLIVAVGQDEMTLVRDDGYFDEVRISLEYVTGVQFLVCPTDFPIPAEDSTPEPALRG
jgi:hypothetical protein